MTVVVDLDGTLLNTNTFHKWIFFCLRKSLFFNIIDTVKILYFIILRLCRIDTHKQLKYNILKITEKENYIVLINDFLISLEKYINNEVLEFLEDKNGTYILATAAPEIYTKHISKKYNFNFEVSTPSIYKKDWYENIKNIKKENLFKLLKKENVTFNIDIFFTDHHDDIYLARISRKTILVNPSSKTIKVFDDSKINYSLI